jgi:hypothetical protein
LGWGGGMHGMGKTIGMIGLRWRTVEGFLFDPGGRERGFILLQQGTERGSVTRAVHWRLVDSSGRCARHKRPESAGRKGCKIAKCTRSLGSSQDQSRQHHEHARAQFHALGNTVSQFTSSISSKYKH